jgi:hypothetical protein
MGQAKKRGSFEERKALAVAAKEERKASNLINSRGNISKAGRSSIVSSLAVAGCTGLLALVGAPRLNTDIKTFGP